MNRRIKKKRKCLNGNCYKYGSYRERRTALKITRLLLKEELYRTGIWFVKTPNGIVVIPPCSDTINEHYKRCLRHRLTLPEEIERFREDDND